jgi:hypothetical protein
MWLQLMLEASPPKSDNSVNAFKHFHYDGPRDFALIWIAAAACVIGCMQPVVGKAHSAKPTQPGLMPDMDCCNHDKFLPGRMIRNPPHMIQFPAVLSM